MIRRGLFGKTERQDRLPSPAREVVRVLGASMSCLRIGSGWPIVLIHGNLSTSFLWHGVMSRVRDLGEAVAIDLIGMGRSERIARGPRAYGLDDQQTYLDAFMEVVGFDRNVIMVGSEWGGVLAMDWARRHPQAVRGIVYMESYLSDLTWRDLPHNLRPLLQRLKNDRESSLILNSEIVRAQLIPELVLDPLPQRTLDEFLIGFETVGESRRAAQTLMMEIPIGGEPSSTHQNLLLNEEWMSRHSTPKLRILGDPGLLIARKREERTSDYPNQRDATVRGKHFLAVEDPEGLATALSQWIWSLA